MDFVDGGYLQHRSASGYPADSAVIAASLVFSLQGGHVLKRCWLCLHPWEAKQGWEGEEGTSQVWGWPWFCPPAARGRGGRTAGGPAWSTRCVRTCPAPKGCPASGTSSARPTTGTPARRKASWQLSSWMVSFFISPCNSLLFFDCSFSSAGLPLLVRRLQ